MKINIKKLSAVLLIASSSAMATEATGPSSSQRVKKFEDYSEKFNAGKSTPSLDGVMAGLRHATDIMKKLNESGKFFMNEEEHLSAFDVLRDSLDVLTSEKTRHSELSDLVIAYSAELALMNPGSLAVAQALVTTKNVPHMGLYQSLNNVKDLKKKNMLLKMLKVAEQEAQQGNG